MPVISKQIFDKASSPEITCRRLLHPTTDSCIKGIYDIVLSTSVGASKFFLLIYMLKTLIKWKKMNRNFIKKQIKAYIRSVFYALCYAINFCCSACLLRNCMREFHFYSMALSGVCAGLTIFMESKENRILNTSLFTNLVVQTIFRYLYWRRTLKKDVRHETLLFMTCSAILLYLLKIQKGHEKAVDFWFYYPPPINKRNKQNTTKVCNHQNSCWRYVSEGFFNYFMMGYLLNMLKYIIPRISIIFMHKNILELFLNKNKIFVGLFFGAYAGIYRICHCILTRTLKREDPMYSAVAGFLAGSAYLFKPTLPILASSVTTVLQLLLQRINCKKTCQLNLPATEIIFALCSGFLLHNRFFLSESCPNYVKLVLNVATNGKINEIYEQALRLLAEDFAGAIET